MSGLSALFFIQVDFDCDGSYRYDFLELESSEPSAYIFVDNQLVIERVVEYLEARDIPVGEIIRENDYFKQVIEFEPEENIFGILMGWKPECMYPDVVECEQEECVCG
ncbi:MAG: hypothetical protein CL489_16555 [Acidobacteria bacterium]|nr:hypothetical protein [Acidobacteriota bacterium]|tara:strand:+ start:1485 stop:1808 length:324 start_codon:yes stop_codon:yes gene_type:complete